MRADYSERAGKTLQDLPPNVQKALFKQVKFLEQNLRHPSLRAKKYDESQDLWQARVNKDWRFYFLIQQARPISARRGSFRYPRHASHRNMTAVRCLT